MLQKKRIFNIEGHLRNNVTSKDFYVGVPLDVMPDFRPTLLGLNSKVGSRAVPLPLGPVSKYNARGKVIKLNNQPKELRHQRRYGRKHHNYLGTWHLWMWQRVHLDPLKIMIETVKKDSKILFISPLLEYIPENEEINRHVVNLFLELFGKVNFYDTDLNEMVCEPNARQVDWEILPPGESLEQREARVIEYVEKSERKGIRNYKDNLKVLNTYGPSDIAVGKRGFDGYFAYSYSDKGVTLVECPEYGNATYVLGMDWEETSQLTKSEIISGNLCIDRIPHDKNWASRVNAIMS
jgi:hypothetical protein